MRGERRIDPAQGLAPARFRRDGKNSAKKIARAMNLFSRRRDQRVYGAQ
jgi:hypothetical protein